MGFRINPRGVDKNKRNTEAKQSQNKTNTGSVEDKIKQYFNSQDDIVSMYQEHTRCIGILLKGYTDRF